MRALGKPQRRLFVAVLLGLVTILAVIYFPRERLLLQRATRVARLDTWTDGSNFLWLSGQEILLFHLVHDPSPPHYLSRLNLITGQKTPLPALGRLLDKSFAGGSEYVSPDGQWLLWTDYENETGIYGASLDGLHQVHVPDFGIDDILWMPDSRHWIELLEDDNGSFTSARVRSIDDPHFIQRMRFPAALSLDNAWLIAVTPQAHLLTLTSHSQTDNQTLDFSAAKLCEFDLHAPFRLLRTFPVHGPKDATDSDRIALSPQNDRIAWLRKAEYAPPSGCLWLHRLFPRFKVPPPHLTVALWISQRDGSRKREIGQVAINPNDNEAPHLVQWSPDGKRLSFVYQDGLYTVPAD